MSVSHSDLLDLVTLLSDPKPEVRKIAVQTLLSLSQNGDTRSFLRQTEVVRKLLRLTADIKPIALDALSMLINLSVDLQYSSSMLDKGVVEGAMEVLIDKKSDMEIIKRCGMLLANVTLSDSGAERILQLEHGPLQGLYICQILKIFIDKTAMDDMTSNTLYLLDAIRNICRVPQGQQLMLNKDRALLEKILKFACHEDSRIRESFFSILQNVCFAVDAHEYLLSSAVDIIRICFHPLAVSDTFVSSNSSETVEDYDDDMPPLEDSGIRKGRDECRKVWASALNVLHLLCSSRRGRDESRRLRVYPMLRDLDHVVSAEEEDMTVLIHGIVEILLQDEVDAVTTDEILGR